MPSFLDFYQSFVWWHLKYEKNSLFIYVLSVTLTCEYLITIHKLNYTVPTLFPSLVS